MKRYLLLLFVFCTLYNQSDAKGTLAYFPARKGLTVGLGFSKGATIETPGNTSGKELRVGYMFNDRFGIFTGYGQQAMSYEEEDYYYTSVKMKSLKYATIPLFIRLVSSRYRHVGIHFEVGFQANLLREATEDKIDIKTDLTAVSPVVFFGTGITIPIISSLECNVGFETSILYIPDTEELLPCAGGKIGLNYRLPIH